MRTLNPDGIRPDEPDSRFRLLFEEAYPHVLRFVQRRVHPSHAEDVTADAFLVAWRRMSEAPRRPDDLRAWLFGIARNCLLNTRRGQGRREALAVRISETSAALDPPDGADEDFPTLRLDLAAAWRRLSAADQETLSLVVFEELDSAQAGRVLGISASSFRVRLTRARRALRRQLEHAGATPDRTGEMES